jgi:hypothetical protein
LAELNQAFTEVVGTPPVGESALMLQRLPGIDRLDSESEERRFVDTFILDGLRADDLQDALITWDKTLLSAKWLNPLQQIGIAITSRRLTTDVALRGNASESALRCCEAANAVMASDLVASLMEVEEPVDLRGAHLRGGHAVVLDVARGRVRNVHISECFVDHLIVGQLAPQGVTLSGCEIRRLSGITAEAGLPDWISNCRIAQFDQLSTTSLVRRARLSDPQKILVTIVRKTFFQRGAARKEAALLRGLGAIGKTSEQRRIINVLRREGILTEERGEDGAIYVPVNKHRSRMTQMLSQLDLSRDPIWSEVSAMAAQLGH